MSHLQVAKEPRDRCYQFYTDCPMQKKIAPLVTADVCFGANVSAELPGTMNIYVI